jgi:hypothetical protein
LEKGQNIDLLVVRECGVAGDIEVLALDRDAHNVPLRNF